MTRRNVNLFSSSSRNRTIDNHASSRTRTMNQTFRTKASTHQHQSSRDQTSRSYLPNRNLGFALYDYRHDD